ncbi:hypothetical protein AAG906_028114 [Vitis piasezkii]
MRRMHPPRMSAPSCIVPPTEQLVIRPHIVPLLPTFHGMESENPYAHIKEFEEVCNTFQEGGASINLMRLKLFPFTLKDKAKLLETMCEGDFMSKNPEEAMDFLSYMVEVSRGWDESNAREVGRMKRLEELEMKKIREVQAISETLVQAMSCSICQSFEHLMTECPTIPAVREMFGDQANVIRQFKPNNNASYGNTYNSNWRNHPNFSWKPRASQYTQPGQAPRQASNLEQAIVNLSKVVGDFVGDQKSINAQLRQEIDSISRLTNLNTVQEKGKFPSQPHQNPKGIHEVEAQEGESSQHEPNSEAEKEKMKEIKGKRKGNSAKNENLESTVNEEPERTINQEDMMKKHTPPPFPQALHDMIKQVLTYTKFLKDLCTIKGGLNVSEKAFLTEQVNLGASVNFLPCSIYKQLGLGELKPTSITLSLADRSMKIPRGMIEDVLVQVDRFYYPLDFVVLDTDPITKGTNCVPIILGRPFLATSNAIINCRNGVMQLTFSNITIELNIFYLCKKQFHPKKKKNDQKRYLNESLGDLDEGLPESSYLLAILSPWKMREEILHLFNGKETQEAVKNEPQSLF